MQITITNQTGRFDVTELVTTLRWAGAVKQCARTLSFGLVGSAPDCAPGTAVGMTVNGALVFSGIILERTKSTESQVIDCIAYDYGIYLTKNQGNKRFVAVTPEAATAEIAAAFGIQTGNLAVTGIPITRKFFARTLYEMIMTLYTEAAKRTKKAYYVSFSGAKLQVLEKGTAGKILVVKGGSNLMDAAVTENAASLVNKVVVYDENENWLYEKSDAGSAALFGTMQQLIRKQKDVDEAPAVQALLDQAQPTQSVSANCLGDVSCVTGGAVLLQEPVTNLYGQFFIDADLHQWKNGIYTNRLTLNLKAVMDEKAAGEVVKNSAGAGVTESQPANGLSASEQEAVEKMCANNAK